MTEAEFITAYTGHYRATVRWLTTRNVREAEDFAMEAWGRAWEKREQWNGHSPIRNWVLSIAWNAVKTEVRKLSHLAEHIELAKWAEFPVTENPAAAFDVATLLESMTPSHRLAVELFYIEGLSSLEIAEALEMEHNTVKSHLFRGKLEARTFAARRQNEILSTPLG